MLEQVSAAPPDAILGLTAAFKEDSRPEKVNLSVGVYQDASGVTPLLECVRQAEVRLAEAATTKAYLPIPGLPAYVEAVQKLAFGGDSPLHGSGRIAGAQTPGGTGALRVAANFIRDNFPKASIWFSDPTWPNHANIFTAAGVPQKKYGYFDAAASALDFDAMLADINQIPAGDVILLHGCCHNPTGVDPTADQWKQIAGAVYARGVLPLLDFAYQGFADGIEDDAVGIRLFAEAGQELLACSSFSKNFSLYRERVGALTAVNPSADASRAVQTQINRVIRANYSNPPAHGAEIVACILADATLRNDWEGEVAQMRERINGMRQQLVDALAAAGAPGDYSFMTRQRGMFSFSGLTKDQVETLREKNAIYVVGSGRINVAGLTPDNVEGVAAAMAAAGAKGR
ncbi:aspartate/tyrosine/aromatic aminotransferase [Pirellulales bacterium]|nr:aspartate/tyrosine/aromatic aminotransferase [Pirellulales bacterium]